MKIPEDKQRHDLATALADVDALDQFHALPLEEQERFLTWISKSQDEHAYWRRIDILVMGMRMAPRLAPPPLPRAVAEVWTDLTS